MSDFWENKRVLVAGGAGFIGLGVVRELISRGAHITISVSEKATSYDQITDDLKRKISIFSCDLMSFADCLECTSNQEIVLNFAALDGGKVYKQNHSAEIYRTNTQIVLNLLEASKINKIKNFLQISSTEVYSLSDKKKLNENTKLCVNGDILVDGYVWSKLFSEAAAKMYSTKYGMNVSVARLGNVYGAGDYKGVERGRVIPTFIQKALKNEQIVISGSGLQKKSFLYIEDGVRGLLTLVEDSRITNPVNIVGENYITIKKLAALIISLSRSSSSITTKSNDLFSTNNKFISNKKAVMQLGFKENISLKEGIIKTLSFFKE